MFYISRFGSKSACILERWGIAVENMHKEHHTLAHFCIPPFPSPSHCESSTLVWLAHTSAVLSTERIVMSYTNRCKTLWVGLPRPHEHFITVDQFSGWRRHQVWAHRNGEELKNILTQRFASNTVFLSLLMATEVGILFSPSDPANLFRDKLKNSLYDTWGYYSGLFLCLAVFFTVCALYTNYVAWGIIANIGKDNVHTILRSTIGSYAVQLPQGLIVLSIYFFFITFVCLLGILMPHLAALIISVCFILLMIHITSTYSALGRIIMDTGAMGDRVFFDKEEERMSPNDLYGALLEKVKAARNSDIPVNRIYQSDYRKSLQDIEMGDDVAASQTRDVEEAKEEIDKADKEEWEAWSGFNLPHGSGAFVGVSLWRIVNVAQHCMYVTQFWAFKK